MNRSQSKENENENALARFKLMTTYASRSPLLSTLTILATDLDCVELRRREWTSWP